jgi:hypothetical protein
MLWGDVTMTGMYVFDGQNSQMFDLRGVHVAGDHIVKGDCGKWMYVKDHPDARQIGDKYQRVYCPVVEGRQLTICGTSGDIVFKDWEEVDDEESEAEWEKWAWRHLNPGREYERGEGEGEGSAEASGFNPASTVTVYGKGEIPISEVRIGDLVYDMGPSEYTRVLGLYDSYGSTTSRWIHCEDGAWRRRTCICTNEYRQKHLVTESGTFYVNWVGWVRDATEVGNGAIADSYNTIINILNRK